MNTYVWLVGIQCMHLAMAAMYLVSECSEIPTLFSLLGQTLLFLIPSVCSSVSVFPE